MSCPRCDGPLLKLSLEDSAAAVCERCGHVGLPSDHRTEIEPEEPWDESLRRFFEKE